MSTQLMSAQSAQNAPLYLDEQPSAPTQLVVNLTQISEQGDVTVYGLNVSGQHVIEEVSGASNGPSVSFTTTNTFASVTKIVPDSFIDGYIEIDAAS